MIVMTASSKHLSPLKISLSLNNLPHSLLLLIFISEHQHTTTQTVPIHSCTPRSCLPPALATATARRNKYHHCRRLIYFGASAHQVPY